MNGTCITSLGLALCNYPVKMYKDATKSVYEFPQERISMYQDFSSSIADAILYAYG